MRETSIISQPRLSTFERFTSNPEKAVELHNMTMQVGASLMAVIALIELGLRNSVNDQIISDFKKPDWLRQPPDQINFRRPEKAAIKRAEAHAQKAAYSKLSYKEKIALDKKIYPHGVPANIKHETLSKKRQGTFSISESQLISQTTIHFWKRLFSNDYEDMLWKPSIKRVFPMKHIKRTEVSSHLETIYLSRNRVAHHEPVYGQKLDEAYKAISFIRENLGKEKTESQSALFHFTEVQYYRFHIDYVTFKRGWDLMVD